MTFEQYARALCCRGFSSMEVSGKRYAMGHSALLVYGQGEHKEGIEKEQFPFTISLSKMQVAVILAIAEKDSVRYYENGVYLCTNGEAFQVLGSYVSAVVGSGEEYVMFPRSVFSVANKINPNGLNVSFNENTCRIQCGDYVLYCRAIHGKRPNIEKPLAYLLESKDEGMLLNHKSVVPDTEYVHRIGEKLLTNADTGKKLKNILKILKHNVTVKQACKTMYGFTVSNLNVVFTTVIREE